MIGFGNSYGGVDVSLFVDLKKNCWEGFTEVIDFQRYKTLNNFFPLVRSKFDMGFHSKLLVGIIYWPKLDVYYRSLALLKEDDLELMSFYLLLGRNQTKTT